MKKNLLIVLLTIIALATSCKDATIDPIDTGKDNNQTQNINYFYNKVWYLDSCNGVASPMLTAFRFDSTGSFYDYSSNRIHMGIGNMVQDSVLPYKFFTYNDFNGNMRSYRIYSQTVNSLELALTTDGGNTFGERAFYRTVETPTNTLYNSITIYGEISNPNNFDLGPNPHVYLVFTRSTNQDGTGGEYMYNYIEGTVDVSAKKYQITVTGKPDDKCIRKYSPNGELALGEVVLSKDTISLKSYYSGDSNYLGGVNNIGLVWKTGKFSSGTEFNWRDAFNEGWSIGWGYLTNPYEPNKSIQSWIAPRHWEIPHKIYRNSNNNNIIVTKSIKKISYPLEWFR